MNNRSEIWLKKTLRKRTAGGVVLGISLGAAAGNIAVGLSVGTLIGGVGAEWIKKR